MEEREVILLQVQRQMLLGTVEEAAVDLETMEALYRDTLVQHRYTEEEAAAAAAVENKYQIRFIR